MIKGRDHHGKGAPAAADLLVCFPSRAHLSLMPKPICSPARPSEPSKRHHSHNHHLHRLKKSGTRGSAGQASPLMWAKSKSMGGSEMASEPTSPKVTCAGQIKVRHKAGSCKSWQSVMEEIEKMHKSGARKQRKSRPGWAEALGFKKEVMQFLTCLRTIRFDFRCFGSFHGADITSDDDDDDEEEEEDEFEYGEDRFRQSAPSGVKAEEAQSESSRTVFSKWFMVLQEEQNRHVADERDDLDEGISGDRDGGHDAPAVPPPNALLLMRCRSAPAKSWLEERAEEEEDDEQEQEREEEEGHEKRSNRSLRFLMDEDEERKAKENVVIMRYQYEPDFDSYKISSDIAKETWVVGGVRDPLSRSRSWKR